MREKTKTVVYTVAANCQDCYRCVRVCPVKAISVIDGQAYVEDELCIQCGTCVRECPQGAKTIRSGLDHVKDLINSDKKVAVSLAPSFVAAFPLKDSRKMPSALKKLGFQYVSETAEGAQYVTEKSFHKFQTDQAGQTRQTGISSACPAVVSYIEKYRPEHIDNLIAVVSPMIAHGRLLKQRLGNDWAVVFIGSCAAKKGEADREEYKGTIEGVLTFTELLAWMDEEGIILENCQESNFDNEAFLANARLFPIQGGMLKAGDIEWDGTDSDVIHISSAEDVIGILDLPADDWSFKWVEPLFCAGGCINGPGFPKGRNLFARKQDVISYAKNTSASEKKENSPIQGEIDYEATFSAKQSRKKDKEVSEEVIQDILEKTGKSDPLAQLNCGACGYKSCRDNAIAVAKGMAETEMCVSYMRRMAQQRGDRIVETTPNGVVILDKDLNIVSMNPAFKNMFMCQDTIIGRPISYLLDDENYQKLASGQEEQNENVKTKYGIKYHEKTYALRGENKYVGLYSDLSSFKFDESQIDLIKNQTLEQAKELLHHQIEFSQQMANFLGKSTAQSEEMVKRIMDLYDENDFKQKV